MSWLRRATLATVLGSVMVACLPPEWGASAILHPFRRPLIGEPDLPYRRVEFQSDGLRLRGWLFPARGDRRGLVVYLHGIADNRRSGEGIARRLTPLGYDVVAYDGRAHGQSEGRACTYGFYEKHDLSRALDAVGATDAILLGSSLGGAVALQAAELEPRVRGVIAQSAFADLTTIVHERAPRFASRKEVAEAIAIAGEKGRFDPVAVSPVRAAGRLSVPVLLLHGARDTETPPAHSRRLADALGARGRLLVLPQAGHDDVLGQEGAWEAIHAWLASLPARGAGGVTMNP